MNKTKYLAQEILDLPMQKNDAGADTIGNYLKELLSSLWEGGVKVSVVNVYLVVQTGRQNFIILLFYIKLSKVKSLMVALKVMMQKVPIKSLKRLSKECTFRNKYKPFSFSV